MKISKFSIIIAFFYICIIPYNAQAQEILGTFKTKYGDFGKIKGRAHNIRRTVEIISNYTILPGDKFSFNEIVGKRTRKNGFREAPVIVNKEITKGLGGGICQVASTIHAAAFYAGLAIIERHPHTRISRYISPGLDATINWGAQNLVIENNFNYPITLLVETRKSSRKFEEIVEVKFLALKKTHKTKVVIFSKEIEQPNTVIVEDRTLKPDQKIVIEPGTPKVYTLVRRKILSFATNKIVREERIEMIYSKSDKIINVGVNSNTLEMEKDI